MTDTATLPRSGLFATGGTAVPLAGVSIQADISNLSARVVIAQRYVNIEAHPIEATYLFPLDESAAVCGFEAIVDGTLVVGEVKPRDEAFEAYDDAMARGDGAFLLDEERPDVFQASVGNLPPGREALLKITYVAELPVDSGSARFVIPTTVSPRYAPAEDQRGVGRPDADTLNPPVAWSVPYGLDISVRLRMSERLGRIESPSHPIAIALEDDGATITLGQREVALDRDFVLTIGADALATPRAWLERSPDGSDAVAISFVPKLPDAQAPSEVIFVVDRSGSMQGASIAEVRNALQLCLRSLIAGCRFNIIGFGSSVDPLFHKARDYGDDTLREASEHVAQLDADLGGTEILPALKLALEGPRHGELPRQVVVLTDGEVTNTDAVIALAASHAADARIFTFGIGAGASHHLVKGLARAGGGSAEFIYPGERIEPKVVRQVGRLLSPALANVRVDWGGLDVTQAPSATPPVFAGGRTIVYGFLRRPLEAPAVARLSANASSGPVSFEVSLEPEGSRSGNVVATLAARARIRELEESPEWVHARGSRQRDRKVPGTTREIIDLAIRYGLVSRETSYIAIERRETPVTGDVQLRRIPIALTTGWGGAHRGTLFAAKRTPMVAARYDMPDMSRATYSLDGGEDDPSTMVAFSRAPAAAHEPHASRVGGWFRARRESAVERTMHALASLQPADGHWDLSDELLRLLRVDGRGVEAVLDGATGDAGEVRAALATALALAWLVRHARSFEDEWHYLAKKGFGWLAQVTARPQGEANWIDVARQLV